MNRDGHSQAQFFTGVEIENSPALGMATLFVVGLQSFADIDWQIGLYNSKHSDQISHIYFGANQSFTNPDVNDGPSWDQWESMILPWLDKGFICTLDLDVSATSGLVEGQLCERHNFIPMISVKLPYAKLLGYNAVIKIDDQDFAATNPGVWCHLLHNLMNRDKFTAWSEYATDTITQ